MYFMKKSSESLKIQLQSVANLKRNCNLKNYKLVTFIVYFYSSGSVEFVRRENLLFQAVTSVRVCSVTLDRFGRSVEKSKNVATVNYASGWRQFAGENLLFRAVIFVCVRACGVVVSLPSVAGETSDGGWLGVTRRGRAYMGHG